MMVVEANTQQMAWYVLGVQETTKALVPSVAAPDSADASQAMPDVREGRGRDGGFSAQWYMMWDCTCTQLYPAAIAFGLGIQSLRMHMYT
jgi:hypothetical protein